MVRRFYSVLFYLILPLVMLRLLYRAVRSPGYAKRIAERFGYFNKPSFVNATNCNDVIWVHAVSVGETIAAAPLIEQLLMQEPPIPIVVTTMTPTGSERVKALFNDRVFHVYAPYDLPGCVKRFLKKIEPKLLIIMETELWPNMLHFSGEKNIPIILANARLSARSAKGYQKFSRLSKPMLQNLSMVAAQHKHDAERFCNLGLSSKKIKVTGSIKFDIKLDEKIKDKAAELKAAWSANGKRTILIAASTHDGEDEKIIDVYKQLLSQYPALLLILVPRHPERFDKVAMLCQRSELQTLRRSEYCAPSSDTQVLLCDTMGELLLMYGCSDIAFVGGSLVDNGGHNMLEPAAWGVPIITGKSDFNFAAISALLQQSNSLIVIKDEYEMTKKLAMLLNDAALCKSMGNAALAVVESNRGALKKLLMLVRTFL